MIGIPIPGGVRGKPESGTQSSGVGIKGWTLTLEGFSNLWNSIILWFLGWSCSLVFLSVLWRQRSSLLPKGAPNLNHRSCHEGKIPSFPCFHPDFCVYSRFPASWQVLSCLVQIASVRRSLFNNAERAKFLSHLVDGVKRILENPQVSVPAGNRGSVSSPITFHPKKFLLMSHLDIWQREGLWSVVLLFPFPTVPPSKGGSWWIFGNNFFIGRVFKGWNHPWKCLKSRKCGNSWPGLMGRVGFVGSQVSLWFHGDPRLWQGTAELFL